MAEKNSKLSSNAKANATATNVSRIGAHSNRPRIVQNYLLVWLDANATTSNQDSQHTLEQLRTIVNDVNTFTEPEQCLTFLQDIHLEKVFLIVSGSLGRDLVPRIHPLTQVDAILHLLWRHNSTRRMGEKVAQSEGTPHPHQAHLCSSWTGCQTMQPRLHTTELCSRERRRCRRDQPQSTGALLHVHSTVQKDIARHGTQTDDGSTRSGEVLPADVCWQSCSVGFDRRIPA